MFKSALSSHHAAATGGSAFTRWMGKEGISTYGGLDDDTVLEGEMRGLGEDGIALAKDQEEGQGGTGKAE